MLLSTISLALTRLGWLRGAWSPSRLFEDGEQGAWYDPSDLSTMFQDSAGTIPMEHVGTVVDQPVGLILDKSGNGHDAFQATATARPVLSARLNLLTKTEDFADVIWSSSTFDAFGSGSVVNATASPIGTTTADFLRPSIASSSKGITNNPTNNPVGNCVSVYVKAAGYSKVAIKESVTTGSHASFDLSSGLLLDKSATVTANIDALSDGWFRISMVNPSAASIDASLTPERINACLICLGVTGLILLYILPISQTHPTFGSGSSPSIKIICW